MWRSSSSENLHAIGKQGDLFFATAKTDVDETVDETA